MNKSSGWGKGEKKGREKKRKVSSEASRVLCRQPYSQGFPLLKLEAAKKKKKLGTRLLSRGFEGCKLPP